MIRGDKYYAAVCNKTGCLAIYNKSKIDIKIKQKTKETIEEFFLEHNEKLYKMINTKFRWQSY